MKLYELQDLFPNADASKIQKCLAKYNYDIQKCIESLFQTEMNNPNTSNNTNNNNSESTSPDPVKEAVIPPKRSQSRIETPTTTPSSSSASTRTTTATNTNSNTNTTTTSTETSTSADFELAQEGEDGQQCAICLETKKVDFMFIMQECSHSFCRNCVSDYFKSKINDRVFPIKCPNFGCKKEATEADLEMVLDRQMIDKYSENSFRNAIRKNPSTFSCCPTPDCPYIFFFAANDSPDFGCPTCKKRYCLNCRVPYHTGSTCEAFQKWSLENGMSDDLFGDFVRGHKFKQCAGCKHWVEKIEGCNHMSCTCGYEFCYKCGGRYIDGCANCAEDGDEDEDEEHDDEYFSDEEHEY